MIKFGIIGTNFIVDTFLDVANSCNKFQLTAIYSRNEDTAKKFAEKYNIENIFTNLDDMANSGKIDAVYIASPNSFHCEHSLKFLEKKIAVLCEKPLASNEKEVKLMIKTAKNNNTVFMEAMRLIYNPTYEVIKLNLNLIGKIRGVFTNFCKYSSRFDSYKNGIVENAFKLNLSNGSLMDIGIYPISFVINLFGTPNKIQAEGTLLETGVDGCGSALFKYDDFTAIINHSKIATSDIPSEIVGENGSIIINNISLLENVILKYKHPITKEFIVKGLTSYIPNKDIKNDMYFELETFISQCENIDKIHLDHLNKNSLECIKILDEIRKQIGIIYPSDLK